MSTEKRHLMTVPHDGHRDDETCPMCRERRDPTPTQAPTATPAGDTTGAGA